MMVDVDALNRRFGPLITYHYCISAILYNHDKQHQPIAYQALSFHLSATINIIPPDNVLHPTPVISSTYMNSVETISEPDSIATDVLILSSSPAIVITAFQP